MEHKIVVVGIGPGSPDYILPVALNAIRQAKIIIGSSRALVAFAPQGAIRKVIDKDVKGLLDYIQEVLASSDVVVMVSGDPGFYSLLTALNGRFTPQQLEVIPGISSMQLAFAKISAPWQDAVLISLHGRDTDKRQLEYEPGKKIGILTDGVHNPGFIAKLLLAQGWPDSAKVWLCSDLSYEQETITPLVLKTAHELTGYNHCVMVVTS